MRTVRCLRWKQILGLTADGPGASQASLVSTQTAVAADQQVLHVLVLLLLTRLRRRRLGDWGGTVLTRHRPRKLLRLRVGGGRGGRGGEEERSEHSN